jgi:hypothetical protein
LILKLDLMKIAAGIQTKKIKDKEINSNLEKWLEKYRAIPVNFCDEPWSMEDARNQLDALLKKDCSLELEKSEKNIIERSPKKSEFYLN